MRLPIRSYLVGSVAGVLLCACATTARLYPTERLNALTRDCGFALGTIYQEAEEPRLLFLIAPEAPPAQLACVQRFARKRNLHVAHIAAVVESPS